VGRQLCHWGDEPAEAPGLTQAILCSGPVEEINLDKFWISFGQLRSQHIATSEVLPEPLLPSILVKAGNGLEKLHHFGPQLDCRMLLEMLRRCHPPCGVCLGYLERLMQLHGHRHDNGIQWDHPKVLQQAEPEP
jgi:hypothetical protein